mgnify:CR=1 FL=1
MSAISAAFRSQPRRLTGTMHSPWEVFKRTLSYCVFLLVTVIVVAPVVWMVLVSLRTQSEYTSYPVTFLPSSAHWENYYRAVFEYTFLPHTWNSLQMAVPSTILTVLSSALAGFGFARHRAPLRNIMFIVVLSWLMVPRMVTTIPTFMLFSKLRLTNTYWPWVLWGLGGSSYHIFLFRQFFAAIPKDLEDAAEVDGCSRFRIFWQIFMPISGPVIATASILHFQWVWGDWFTPQIFLNAAKTSLGVLLSTAYHDPKGFPLHTLTLAAITVYILPMLIVFFVAQKYIIQGIVTTGIKG